MVGAIHRYLANQIIDDDLDYSFVISKRIDLKQGIDEYLTSQGHADKIKTN